MTGFAIAVPRRRKRRRRKPDLFDRIVLVGFVAAVVFAVADVLNGDFPWLVVQSVFVVGNWVSPNIGWWLFARGVHPPGLYPGAGRILYLWIIGEPDD